MGGLTIMEKNEANQNGKYNLLLILSISSFIILFGLFIWCGRYQLNNDAKILQTAINENNKIIQGLTFVNNKTKKNEFTIKNDLITDVDTKQLEIYKDFLIKHYEGQHNWLMVWFTVLALVFGILGIGIPLCFMKFFDSKKIEMDKLIEEAQEKKNEINKAEEKIKTLDQKSGVIDSKIKEVDEKMKETDKKSKEVDEKSKAIDNKIKEINELLEMGKKYVQQTEDNKDISTQLALLTKEIGDKNYEEALKHADSIAELFPNIPDGYAFRGYIYDILNKHKEAIENYNKAIEIKPTFGSYNNRGVSFIKLNQFEKAIQDFSKAIKINSVEDYVFINRAKAFMQLNKYNEALLDCNVAIKLKQSSQNYSLKGFIYHDKLKDYKLGIENYIKALSLPMDESSKPGILYNLTEAYMYDNNMEKTLKYLKAFIEATEKPYIYDDDKDKWLSCVNKNLDNPNAVEIKKLIDEKLTIKKR